VAGTATAAAVQTNASAGAGGQAQTMAHLGGREVRTGLAAEAGVISTLAGGVGGPARATRVALSHCGVAFSAGFVYAGARDAVRKVSLRTGWLTTPAGTGSAGPLGDGGPAARAALQDACGVTVERPGRQGRAR
jgi:hypothetical protein